MRELFKSWSLPQRVLFVISPVLLIMLMFFIVWVIESFVSASEIEYEQVKMYQVTDVTNDDYYFAVQVVRAEDDTYVPESYYGRSDKTIAYSLSQVQGDTPEIGDYIMVSVREDGSDPLVEVAE